MVTMLPSVMSAAHDFSRVPSAEIPRSSFDRSHGLKTTFDAGYLVPVFWDLIYPGDTMNLSMTFVIRQSTPFKPLMDNLYAETFFFFCPMRILWSNWQKFNGEQTNPGDSVTFSIPYIASPTSPGIVSNTLGDYFGLPVGLANSFNFNSFYFRAYNRCVFEWFRDENLQNAPQLDTGDGPDTYSNYVLVRRGKRHDYFTSCLPWPQKNNSASVTVPLGSSATVKTSSSRLLTGAQNPVEFYGSDGNAPAASKLVTTGAGAAATKIYGSGTAGTDSGFPFYPSNLYADLSTATAATINSLRQAFQLQKLYERDARGGTRYYEVIKAHFGVTDPGHAVLQRPQFLGGGSTRINLTPVAQTTVSASPTQKDGQGNLAAFGVGVGHGHGFTRSFTEHGVIIGLISVRADLTYQQGLERELSYRTRFDMYWPALAHIGEQSVLNQEIYCQANGASGDTLVFGYQERFAEARYKSSKITGLFRSNVSSGKTSIDFWHLSQNFGSLPTLGDTFIQETPPMDRVSQVTSAGGAPHFLMDSYFKYLCARPMPVYGVPGMMDRF